MVLAFTEVGGGGRGGARAPPRRLEVHQYDFADAAPPGTTSITTGIHRPTRATSQSSGRFMVIFALPLAVYA
jgi:hypothetical protein